MFSLQDLVTKMHVEEIDTNLFSGDPIEMGLPRVFGGQVLGQALNAADRTVDSERRPHSLHGYFLRPGDVNRPIIYEVDPIRDGRSFSTRRVVAKQKGQAIFNASISFQKLEDGLSHQIDLPENIPSPEELKPDYLQAEDIVANTPGLTVENFKRYYLVFDQKVADIRTPKLREVLTPGAYEPVFGFWFKFNDNIGNDPLIHRTLLAFISDKALMSVGLRPHPVNYHTHRIIGASLDHAMWFHSEIRVNQWIYYHIDSPRSARSRDLGRGSFYTRSGELIASTAQEGLIRLVGKKAKN